MAAAGSQTNVLYPFQRASLLRVVPKTMRRVRSERNKSKTQTGGGRQLRQFDTSLNFVCVGHQLRGKSADLTTNLSVTRQMLAWSATIFSKFQAGKIHVADESKRVERVTKSRNSATSRRRRRHSIGEPTKTQEKSEAASFK